MSRGKGNTIVEFFSEEIEFKVLKNELYQNYFRNRNVIQKFIAKIL